VRDRVLRLWESYRADVVPEGAGRAQLVETKRAFYAGAQAFLGMLMTSLEPGKEPTEADLTMMDEVAEELRAFGRAMADGGVGG